MKYGVDIVIDITTEEIEKILDEVGLCENHERASGAVLLAGLKFGSKTRKIRNFLSDKYKSHIYSVVKNLKKYKIWGTYNGVLNGYMDVANWAEEKQPNVSNIGFVLDALVGAGQIKRFNYPSEPNSLYGTI